MAVVAPTVAFAQSTRGERISLRNKRAIIEAIHSGALAWAGPVRADLWCRRRTEWPGVPKEILLLRQTWTDKAAYKCDSTEPRGLVPGGPRQSSRRALAQR